MAFLKYLFTVTPGTYFHYYTPLLILAALLFIGGITLSYLSNKNKAIRRTVKTYPKRINWAAILLALAVALRYEGIPYFSMRFFLGIILLWITYLLWQGYQLYRKRYPMEVAKENRPGKAKAKYSAKKKR